MLVKGAETAVLNQLASGPGDVTLDHVNEYAEVRMQTLIPGCPNEIYCLQDYSLRHKERKKERKKKREKRSDWQTDTDRRERQTDMRTDIQTDRRTERTERQTDGRTCAGRAKKRTDRPKKALKERRKEERKTGSTKKAKRHIQAFTNVGSVQKQGSKLGC